jgi:hypothetical protein
MMIQSSNTFTHTYSSAVFLKKNALKENGAGEVAKDTFQRKNSTASRYATVADGTHGCITRSAITTR